jgi:hypothetical protein
MNTSFNLFVSEEYGYNQYLITISGITIKEFLEYAATIAVEEFYFSSYGFFKELQEKLDCSIKGREIVWGNHPLYGQGRFILKDEHSEDEGYEPETHPEFFTTFKYDAYTHMHEKDDSYIQVGDETFPFG